MNYKKKIKIVDPYNCGYSYSNNWSYLINSLRCLHRDDGVLLDDFIENSFDWELDKGVTEGRIPYREPWVGFVQCPNDLPQFLDEYRSGPKTIFEGKEWKESAPYCQGLFCLSNYHRKWLETNLNIPIANLLLPTPTPRKIFSLETFASNKDKKIVQIGVYLRRLISIYQLPVNTMKKVFLKIDADWVDELIEAEKKRLNTKLDDDSTEVISFLPDGSYDELLSKNIVFLHLYDSASNNTVVECIARNTPILVNPLEAVQEYLGEGYPYYFQTLDEAARKAENFDLIVETYEYLQKLPIKKKLTQDYFRQSFVESDIYRKL